MMTPGDPQDAPRIDYGRKQGDPTSSGIPSAGASLPGHSPAPVTTASSSGRGGVGWATYAVTIVAFLILIVVVVFVTQNTTKIPIKFFGSTKVVSVAAALAGSAFAGLLVGLLLGALPQIRLRRELRQLRRGAR